MYIMKTIIIASTLLVFIAAQTAAADSVPEWVKNTAGWWAQDQISDNEFVGAIQHLVQAGIIAVQYNEQSAGQSETVPEWVKNTAGWWAQDQISDNEFVGAIQHLVQAGIITIESQGDPRMAQLEEQLAACSQYTKAYQRFDCEDEINAQITRLKYETHATPYRVGQVAYYFPGADLEITSGGQPLLTIRMLASNEGTDNVTLSCTGPAICNYDVTDGTSSFKYASTDFTSGSITIKPGDAREFEMIFGPNVGYGGTTFEYDPQKEYHFRISESFGSLSIPLNLN